MDNFLSHAQLMDLLRYAEAKSLPMLSFTFYSFSFMLLTEWS